MNTEPRPPQEEIERRKNAAEILSLTDSRGWHVEYAKLATDWLALSARLERAEAALRATGRFVNSVERDEAIALGLPKTWQEAIAALAAVPEPAIGAYLDAQRCPICEGVDLPGLIHNTNAPYCSAAVPDPDTRSQSDYEAFGG